MDEQYSIIAIYRVYSTMNSRKKTKKGEKLVKWARHNMPVLRYAGQKLLKSQILESKKISISLSITPETANLVLALSKSGAEVSLCASHPDAVNEDVASYLREKHHFPVLGKKGVNKKTFEKNQKTVLIQKPDIIIDDGGELVEIMHRQNGKNFDNVIGAAEQTTTGVVKANKLEKSQKLQFPIIAVNNNQTKNMFDNRYGTGQSTLDALMRTTNILLAGKNIIVCGYGWCGRGLAIRAKGMGANVTVCEVDHVKALEAHMDGFRVEKLEKAIQSADVVISITGNINVISKKHINAAKDGVILAQSGHSDVEIDKKMLKRMATKVENVRKSVNEYTIGKKRIYLVANGAVLNLSAADGNSPSVMDMSFAGQIFALDYLVRNQSRLENSVYHLPSEIDDKIAKLKLKSRNISIDSLTSEQREYLGRS